jgi:RNA polymerase sigma factor (sigma-70 family)
MTLDFESLVRDHARLMASAIRRVCGRRHEALIPDVEQEVHLALWKRLGSGKTIDHPRSYVYKVALTTALAVLRRHQPEEAVEDERLMHEIDTRDAAAAGMSPAERRVVIDQALATLPDDQGRALRAYLAGFNHSEVAELFGWTPSVARHRIYRGLEALQETARRERGEPHE